MPKVSVILTTYNRKELLQETIQGVLDQTFSDFELIVVDNCSNYDFLTLIKSFNDKRIRAFQNQNNGIIAVNRNVGIRKAKGEYLAFCDDDDIWLPQKLEKQLKLIKDLKLENEKILIYTNCINFSEKTSKFTNKKEIKTINDLVVSNEVTYSSVLISFNINDPIFFFNEAIEFVAVEDYLFWSSLKVNKFKFYLLTEPLVRYRDLKNSMSNINYGLNHLRRVFALCYVVLKFDKIVKVNYFVFTKSIFKETLKFGIKNIYKRKYTS